MKFTFKRKSKNGAKKVKCKERYLFQLFDKVNLWLQHKCVLWLEQKTAHLSAKSWIVILFCFVVFTVSGNVYLIVNGLNGKNSKSIEVSPISRPTNKVVFDSKQNQLNTHTRNQRFINSILFSPNANQHPLSTPGSLLKRATPPVEALHEI